MSRKKTESVLSNADVVAIQGNRHGLTFIRSMLSGLKVKRYRAYLDCERAFRDISVDPPSLLITDWEMKARSGYWLTTTLRSSHNEVLRAVPILVLTSEMSPSVLDVALDSGANAVAVKPLSAEVLRRRIESLIEVPQLLVEHEERLIPRDSKDALENRLRPLESQATRARRTELKAALQRVVQVEVVENQPGLADAATGESGEADPFSWRGFASA